MPSMIKCYIDIGCAYQGEESTQNIYDDIENWNINDCGIISILKLEIDPEKRTSKEILFKQVLSPMYNKFRCSDNDYRIYASCILKEFKNVDLFVTFNGRDFDIPIIINNLNLSDRQKQYYVKYFTDRDRDLLDICVLKDMHIKGGLRGITKRLNIEVIDDNHNDDQEICFLNDSDPYINRYNYRLMERKRRNKSDIKVLPLLEEKLGFLYEPRSFVDRHHKKWTIR